MFIPSAKNSAHLSHFTLCNPDAAFSDPPFAKSLTRKVIGLASNVVSELSAPTKAFRQEFKNLQLYLASHELPEDLCSELREFVSLKFESKEEHTEVRPPWHYGAVSGTSDNHLRSAVR